MIQLYKYIGKEAMLEQFAEECVEAAHAALKYARFCRDENPCDASVTKETLESHLMEEMADVYICLKQLEAMGLSGMFEYKEFVELKEERMMSRLIDAQAQKKAKTMKQVFVHLDEQKSPQAFVHLNKSKE